MPGNRAPPSHRRIYAVVSRIPKGRVATYGQVATLAGLPRRARLVGHALGALPAGSPVPWHRVVNAKGQVSVRANGFGFEEVQRQLLEREGVRFSGDRVAPGFVWRPRGLVSAAGPPAPPRPRPRRPAAPAASGKR